MNSLGHYPGDESDNYVGSSAATTVVRKTIHPSTLSGKSPPHTPKLSDGKSLPDQNHKIPMLKPNLLDQQVYQASMKQPTSKLPHDPFQNTYSGQQILLTSGDIEAMTMKQFRIGSIGC